jgi:preprotein translocase subunit SecF
MQILSKTNYNFLRWKWHAIALSLAVILGGFGMIAAKGLPLGIDFSGGTLIVVQFEQPVTEAQVRNAVESLPGEEVVQTYGAASERRMLIRLPQTEGAVEGNSLEQASLQVEQALQKAGLPKFTIVNRELVSAVIGRDLQLRGIYATLASLLAITIYIGIRFRFSFAVGAIVATLHDVLVTLAFLAFFGYDLSLNVVAAILTITGYSVNDTIVIFDRVRENLRSRRRDPLDTIVNESVNQTLSRTIITAGTTFLSVLSIFLFGGEALRGFAFTMLVGIVSGTYSTIFIASAIAIILSAGKARTPAAAAPSGNATASQGGKKQKRAKAS